VLWVEGETKNIIGWVDKICLGLQWVESGLHSQLTTLQLTKRIIYKDLCHVAPGYNLRYSTVNCDIDIVNFEIK
jgi:hypothetical protein